MRLFICLLMALLAPCASVTAHETVTVPLDGIEGCYWVDDSPFESHYDRLVHVELERIPTSVYQVWLHISGSFSAGEIFCDLMGDGTPEGPYPQNLEYVAAMKDSLNGGYHAAISHSPDASGAFEYVNRFERWFGTVDWVFLTAGRFDIHMIVDFGILPECWVTVWPEATIESAELIIEGEFPVAVERSTWGSIKELYR